MTAAEVFLGFYAAYGDGDIDRALSFVSPNVRHEARSDIAPDLTCDSFEGHAGIRARVRQIMERWEVDTRFPARILIANAHHVAATTKCLATDRTTGIRVVIRSAVFSTVQNGLIVQADEVFYSTRMDNAEIPLARSDDALPSADG